MWSASRMVSFVMLHNKNGVSSILKLLQGVQQDPVVPGMEADGRLIQDVRDPVRLEPSCAAKRMRWPSPPERVAPLRSRER